MRLVLAPERLSALYPHASGPQPVKVRVIGQVDAYDAAVATVRGTDTPGTVAVDLTRCLAGLRPEMTDHGAVVDVVGYYDGERVDAYECWSVGAEVLESRDVLDEMAR